MVADLGGKKAVEVKPTTEAKVEKPNVNLEAAEKIREQMARKQHGNALNELEKMALKLNMSPSDLQFLMDTLGIDATQVESVGMEVIATVMKHGKRPEEVQAQERQAEALAQGLNNIEAVDKEISPEQAAEVQGKVLDALTIEMATRLAMENEAITVTENKKGGDENTAAVTSEKNPSPDSPQPSQALYSAIENEMGTEAANEIVLNAKILADQTVDKIKDERKAPDAAREIADRLEEKGTAPNPTELEIGKLTNNRDVKPQVAPGLN